MFLGLGALLALWVVAYVSNAFRDLELNTVDTRFAIRGDKKPPDDLIVVGIDDKTFQDLTGGGRSRAGSTPGRSTASRPTGRA